MTDILKQIPHAVLSHVKWALGAIAQFNDAIRQCRAIETHTGSTGRYEWEYRTGPTGRIRPFNGSTRSASGHGSRASIQRRSSRRCLARPRRYRGRTPRAPWRDER
jgi:hypothetical protein